MDPSTILKKGLRLLQQQLQPEEVLDHLLSVDLLSQVEYDRCRDMKVKCDQTRELVMLLMCKGEQAYKEFCIVLNQDQRHVKQVLDDIALGTERPDLVYIPQTEVSRQLLAKEEVIRHLQQQLELQKQEYETNVFHKSEQIARELDEARRRTINAEKELEGQITWCHRLEKHIATLEKEIKDLQSKSLALPGIEFEMEEEKQTSVIGHIDAMKCALGTSEACDPKQGLVLPCLHTVCAPCLQQHTEKTFICFCGREAACNEIKQVDHVRRNELTRDTNIRCGFLKEPCEGVVVSLCRGCQNYLCQSCTQLHKKIKASTFHDVESINGFPENPNFEQFKRPICDSHSNQSVMFIDHECQKAVCSICHSNLPADHDISLIDDEYQKQMTLLKQVIADHTGNLQSNQAYLQQRLRVLDSLKKRRNGLLQNLSNSYESIVLALKDRFKDLRQNTLLEIKRLQDAIQQDMKSLQETQAAFRMTTDYAQRCLDVDQVQLIALAPMIAQNAVEDRKRLLPKCTSLNKDIVFSPQGLRALHSLIHRVGDIICTERDTVHRDEVPTLKDLQQQNGVSQRTIASLTDEYKMKEAKSKQENDLRGEALSLLNEQLKQNGFYIQEPTQLTKTSILHCIQHAFNNDKVNVHKASITANDELVNKKQLIRFQGQGRLQRYMGTCGTPYFPCPGFPCYLEMVARVGLNRTLTNQDLIFEIGMCWEDYADTEHTISKLPHSYSMAVSHCSIHNRICRMFWKEERHLLCLPTETLPNTTGAFDSLHIGVAYDDSRKKVVFIDVKTSQVMKVLENVDFSQPLLPMFGVYNPERVSVSMRIVTVAEMHMPKEKIKLILRSLS
ncbi:uncharacterized protein [Haliotis cracherodii]|uniref:uncharacterized protein n=1 Tax=Haliotis cracherodii TaxID=6455 RepID=UPI0039E7C615